MPFGHAWVSLAQQRRDVVGMTADLSKYTDLHLFADTFPEHFNQTGMAKQLLMSAAAGMAREGFMPFVTTYAVFTSRRAYDFICMAIAEEHLNIKIACSLPGLTTGYGPSHQATEALEKQGIEVAVVHSPVIKPLDEATILCKAAEAVETHRLVITAENHTVVGGLGEAIAGVVMRNAVTPRCRQIVLPDAFLAAGALPSLHDRYGNSTAAMVKQITAWLEA